MSASNARAKVAELVASAHRDLRHVGTQSQQALADMAGQTGVFTITDAQVQDAEPFAPLTACDGVRLWQRTWEITVRIESSTTIAAEAAERLADVYQQAVVDGLYQRHLYAGAINHIYIPSGWSAPTIEVGAGRHPIARLTSLQFRVQYYA